MTQAAAGAGAPSPVGADGNAAATGAAQLGWRSALIAALVAALVVVLGLAGSEAALAQGVQTLIFVLLAMSLNLIVGQGGMVSMGHAALYAAGGYGAAVLTRHLGVPMHWALPAGVLIAAAVAALIGFFSIRREHHYFIMLTLAFGQLVYVLLWKWTEVTGGDEGLIGVEPPDWLRNSRAYYFLTLVLVLAIIHLLRRLVLSPFGEALTAVRDNPQRAAFTGIPVRAVQLFAFVTAGAIAGLAGGLQAYFSRGVFIESASFLTSADLLAVCVLGGTTRFHGPIVGALVFRALSTVVPAYTAYWLFFLGLFILAVTFWLPNGVVSLFDRRRGGR
jgi:branched-chain amino acid transport system permease protein